MTRGNDVVLKCFANGGTPPLSYKWAKISGHTHPYRAGSYHSQHSFHSELSYQESFHSSLNQGGTEQRAGRGAEAGERGSEAETKSEAGALAAPLLTARPGQAAACPCALAASHPREITPCEGSVGRGVGGSWHGDKRDGAHN